VTSELSPVGFLAATHQQPIFEPSKFSEPNQEIRKPIHIVRQGSDGRLGLTLFGSWCSSPKTNGSPRFPLLATLPALYPEWLGDRCFCESHGVRFPYVAGAMANAIASAELVLAMSKAGMLSFFGSAGLPVSEVRKNIRHIKSKVGEGVWGCNLIHSPAEPELENEIVSLYLEEGITKVSAAAYMGLTPAVVRYALTGLKSGVHGRVLRKNWLFPKVSRPEVALHFMSPAPQEILAQLLRQGLLTEEECELGRKIPLAEDITVESDSGGHTDNRPLGSLFPAIALLRDELTDNYGYLSAIRLGAAGGLGSPSAVAAAFALGAAYVLTGSINQASLESGLGEEGKKLLCQVDIADVIMAPAADMFEMGVKLQVLRRGTMFGVRALKLYDHFLRYESLQATPPQILQELEKSVLGKSTKDIWAEVTDFFQERAPNELSRAAEDPKHQMALVFRWYLGLSSRWAINNDPTRRADYQIWCGPAMGSFNRWVSGSFLELQQNRSVVQIALNLLEGAAILTRAHQLRTYGLPVPNRLFRYVPRPLSL